MTTDIFKVRVTLEARGYKAYPVQLGSATMAFARHVNADTKCRTNDHAFAGTYGSEDEDKPKPEAPDLTDSVVNAAASIASRMILEERKRSEPADDEEKP